MPQQQVYHSVPGNDLYLHAREDCPCRPKIIENGYDILLLHQRMANKKPKQKKPPKKKP